ncbi:hypothetical protein EDC56_2223 [Sinobacterium caligoides]|uniref:Uncharacterized protein n=1 Tax=Sinobacterium caligoides TaxID=933926 RepID=A0A3N2DPM5_9GAMM|nr:hypothetical protein EDC56_2223 [Sinobacterium caligoides]
MKQQLHIFIMIDNITLSLASQPSVSYMSPRRQLNSVFPFFE